MILRYMQSGKWEARSFREQPARKVPTQRVATGKAPTMPPPRPPKNRDMLMPRLRGRQCVLKSPIEGARQQLLEGVFPLLACYTHADAALRSPARRRRYQALSIIVQPNCLVATASLAYQPPSARDLWPSASGHVTGCHRAAVCLYVRPRRCAHVSGRRFGAIRTV